MGIDYNGPGAVTIVNSDALIPACPQEPISMYLKTKTHGFHILYLFI
jgi:hypothetical protein